MKSKMKLNTLKVQSFVTDLEAGKIEIRGGEELLSIGHRCSHNNTCARVCGEPHPTYRAHCPAEQ